jgi:hypothetical protein
MTSNPFKSFRIPNDGPIKNIRGYVSRPKITIDQSEITIKDKKYRKLAESRIRAEFIKSWEKAAEETDEKLKEWLNKSMEEQIWNWPRGTFREGGGGYISPGLRDIVDTGELQNSLKIKAESLKTRRNTIIEYSSSYASYVHNGAYIYPYGNKNAQRVYTPGRPWIFYAIVGMDSIADNENGPYITELKNRLTQRLEKW